MAGPIKISVVTNAIKARRDLFSVAGTVQKLTRAKTFVFDRTAFEAGYARPYGKAMHGVLADNEKTRAYFAKKAASYPPIGKAPKFTDDKDVSFRRALRNYKALGGEARVTLTQINARISRFEAIGTEAYGKVTSKLETYKETADKTAGRVKAIALATAAIGIASRGINAATGALKSAVSSASNLNEQTSRTQQVFGQASKSILDFSQTSAVALGQTSTQTLEAAGNYGNLFINLGLTQKQAAKMSTQLLTTASDLASFNNADPSEMLNNIASALAGEYDPLQRYGIAISAAAVQNEALREGLVKRVVDQNKVKAATLRATTAQNNYTAVVAQYGKHSEQARVALARQLSAQTALKTATQGTAGTLTQAQQAQAAYNLIVRQTGKATGDFQRTQNGLANSMRQNRAGIQNLSAKIGTALLPGVNALSVAFRDKVLPALSDLVDKYGPKVNAFFTRLASSGLPKVSAQLNTVDLNKPFSNLKPGDLDKATDSLARIGSAFVELSGPTGTGVNDTLSVFSIVIKTVADHTKLLAKLMPLLIGAFITYKAAVAAAAAAEVLKLPTKVAEIVVNRQLIASNKALIASRVGETTAVTENIAAENIGTASKQRGVIATLAGRTAALASAAATRVMAASQAALNVVLSLNPIGLVVIAVLALVAAFVVAFRHSERFRSIVNAVFGALKTGVTATIGFIRQNWPLILGVLTGPVGLAVVAFVKYRKRILSLFTGIRDSIVGLFAGIGSVISSTLKAAINTAISLVNQPIAAISKIASKVPGVPDLPQIPALATGGIVRRPTLALVGEAGPEAVVPLNGRFGGGDTYNITVEVKAGVGDPVAIGREVYRTLQALERSTGRRVVSNAAA